MRKRYSLLDDIRGAAILNMIAYHASWDLVYLFGLSWPWFSSPGAQLWQQGICWTFIMLSGFCQPLSRRKRGRSLMVCSAGALVSLVTAVAMPQSKILFGVLTFLGCAMLLMLPLEPLLRRCPPVLGLVFSAALFALSKNIPAGSLGFGPWVLLELPASLYRSTLTAFFGFPPHGFFSADYFPLLPWFFLFLAGYFLYQTLCRRKALGFLEHRGIPPLEWVGRHSLVIYLLHQPLIYLVLMIIFHLKK